MRGWLDDPESADRIHIFKTLESTNRAAKKMALEGAGHGTVVLAETQTHGRGRFGKEFFSPPGSGIYLSILLSGLLQSWNN